MESAEFPERKCREPIWSDLGIAHSCELVDLHPGPHATFSIEQSVENRDRYEAEHSDWRKHINTDFFA